MIAKHHCPLSLSRMGWLGAYLRRAFGDATSGSDTLEEPAVARPKDEEHSQVIDKATFEIVSSAEHLSRVSRAVTKQRDPDHPDSFEHSMRELLGRLD